MDFLIHLPGYRCFNAVMFLTGFIFASIIIYLVCLEEDLMTSYGNVSAALGTGLLFGLITMLVHYVGLFVMGLQSGLLIGVVILTGKLLFIPDYTSCIH